jgi:hypothetical protein
MKINRQNLTLCAQTQRMTNVEAMLSAYAGPFASPLTPLHEKWRGGQIVFIAPLSIFHGEGLGVRRGGLNI